MINALRNNYQLKHLLDALNIVKSSYCYQNHTVKAPDKYGKLRERIRQEFMEGYKSYGYRRIHRVLTDITEFHIPARKVYLSPVLDCFDGMPVSWTIGTSPSVSLANTMLDQAIQALASNEHPIIHSDRGGHYRWPGWIERMEGEVTHDLCRKNAARPITLPARASSDA